MEDGKQKPFSQLVVIGSSAGGIEALSTLVSTLHQKFPAPVVIAQHLDPHRTSHLRQILSQRSTLPVRTLQDRERLEPGVVFVVPADRHVEITDHDIALREEGHGRSKPSIDFLLTSAARLFGEELVAVILTGTGSDGAAGAYEVKNYGGTVIIQNPATAAYPALPQSLSPSSVDIVADLEEIGPLLYELVTQPSAPSEGTDEQALRRLLDQLRDRRGIDFNRYKMPTIMRRLQRRMLATGRVKLTDYMRYLQTHPEEHAQLVSSFLIKVTEFFRDPDLFQYLRESVFPEIIEQARKQGNQIRFWSAGTATGEEAYSLAILLAEVLGDDLERFHIRIFATDLDADAVAFARRGLYPISALSNVSPELLVRYFDEIDGQYEIKKYIRSLTVFGEHDLGDRAPFPRIDLLMCRNVLIYFTTELQRRVLQLFSFSLRDGGWLVLGKAESITPLPQHFVVDSARLKTFRRRGERTVLMPVEVRDRTPIIPPMSPNRPYLNAPGASRLTPAEAQPESSRRRLESILLQLPVGVVSIDRHYDIQMINAVARRLLRIHGAAIGDDLVHLAEDLPSAPLRAAIDATFRGETAAPVGPIEVADLATNEVRYLELVSHPGEAAAEGETISQVVILITDVTERLLDRRRLEESIEQQGDAAHTIEGQIRALIAENGALQEANQELTSVNLELRSANEEFLVGNEELQAASEEVETLNEELQATNEELETLNEELQATVEELNTTNDDLEARSVELHDLAVSLESQRRQSEIERARVETVLGNMGDAVLVVNAAGETLLTNTAYDELFRELDTAAALQDVEGNPLPPEMTPRRRAARGESFRLEFVVRAPGGARCWFEAIGQPIQWDGADKGGVVVIRDITDRSLRRLQDEFLALASHELRAPLTVLRGYLGMLDRYLPADADERLRRYTALGGEQVQRMARLIADLADVTRLQTGRLSLYRQPVDVVHLVRRAVDMAQTFSNGQTIELDAPDGPLIVDGDSGRLEQILLNLLSNAITHAPDSKRIDVRVHRSDDEAEIAVQDYGPGIAETDLPNLFTRFYSSSRPQQEVEAGLGLGLFITDQLVRAHEGSITADSRAGEGATFTIRLPLADQGDGHCPGGQPVSG